LCWKNNEKKKFGIIRTEVGIIETGFGIIQTRVGIIQTVFPKCG
jgi:hypothetical protein